ncbi:hypothetical protein PybrP1_009419 [[Pythium] brassicae (nom. inval.)]|nr:hypothetical protein PybrP1_009419 [[Pythium] brassicae (nom. inval.)]
MQEAAITSCKYASYSTETRQRIVDASRAGDDWNPLAHALKSPKDAVRQWMKCYTEEPDSMEPVRGGLALKVMPEHVFYLCSELDSNNKLALSELRDLLFCTFLLRVSLSTVSSALKCACYTRNKTHHQQQYMNTFEN